MKNVSLRRCGQTFITLFCIQHKNRFSTPTSDYTARWRNPGIESSGRLFVRSHQIGYVGIMKSDDLITVDSEILGGTPVFKGTRVPVKTLFDYLEENYTLEEFLACFPSVTREMARRILERSETALLSKS
jgi:uncharacterized protein (DUF433 family)